MVQQMILIALKLFAAKSGIRQVVAEGPSLKHEVQSIVSKALVGIILSAVLIYAVIQIGLVLQDILLGLPNGIYYEIGALVILAAGCVVALSQVFKDDEKQNEVVAVESLSAPRGDKMGIVTDFVSGFLAAYNEAEKNKALQTTFTEYEPRSNVYLVNQ